MELLVVIAIIGILAALLLTAVSNAKKRAQQTRCTNNVRQLGVALHLFASDNGVYPLAYDGFVAPGIANTWAQPLEQTLTGHNLTHSTGIWRCPAYFPARTAVGKTDYGYNAFGLGPMYADELLGLGAHHRSRQESIKPAVKENEITNPSEMIAIGDGFYGSGNPVLTIVEGIGWLGRPNVTGESEDDRGSTERAKKRHQRKANVVFCDGHVESPTLKSLFEDTSDEALVRWNCDHLPHREKLSP